MTQTTNLILHAPGSWLTYRDELATIPTPEGLGYLFNPSDDVVIG